MHNKIKKLLLGDQPCAIGKIGLIELMHFYDSFFESGRNLFGDTLAINAGVNCRSWTEYEDWVADFANSISNLDALLAWNKNDQEDRIIRELSEDSLIVENFPDIEPFFHGEEGWHYGLADKKVLVVSSFKDTIDAQIPNYSKIWNGAKLGSCEVIRCPQPYQITGGPAMFYIDTMWSLTNEIAKRNFDICIIGAGGFSLPLCNFVKNIGQKAIHLGGATQVLFGIRGSRFDRNFADQSWYGTEHFVSPLESDIPKDKHLVEQGCYW